MLRMPVLDQVDCASNLARLAPARRSQSFRSGRRRGNLKASRRITRLNPSRPGSTPTAAGEWPLKINIQFDESTDAEGTEVAIRYATPDFASPGWEELDPPEPDMASAWSASDIDS